MAQEIAKVAPASAHVVKAFNTILGHVLEQAGRNMDALFAGDDAQAKSSVSTLMESLGLRPLDAGGLGTARWLEGAPAEDGPRTQRRGELRLHLRRQPRPTTIIRELSVAHPASDP
jgi:hypothetical protein